MNDQLDIQATQVPLEAILAMREEYRRSMNCQIVHDSLHERGFIESYTLQIGGKIVGYGSAAGDLQGPKETIKEFYIVPAYRGSALPLFHELISTSRARTIEAQTNDVLLTLMLLDNAVDLQSIKILFADEFTTNRAMPGVVTRQMTERDQETIFTHTTEPIGEWGLESGGEVVATGGLAFHYNPPYGDIYMEVSAPSRRQGYGSYLVQELKRLCYEMGSVPAARCNKDNIPSRLTLQSAGMLPCAHIVRGNIAA